MQRAGKLNSSGAPAPFFGRNFVGTAGWAIPSDQKSLFSSEGSHLERYAASLTGVEINSSFYREHLAKTYARWASTVPAHFRFSVKLSRTFTHEYRLYPRRELLRESLLAIGELEEKFGALLVQLPPSLVFDPIKTEDFLGALGEHLPVPQVWEPRHPSWRSPEALSLLEKYGAVKVQADPEPCPTPLLSTDSKLRYYRLHGKPEMYKSRYHQGFLASLSEAISAAKSAQVWCIFDNTTYGFALENALELRGLLQELAAPKDGLRTVS